MVSDNVYKVDFKRLVVLLLPTFLRRPVIAALLFAFTAPFIGMLSRLVKFRADNVKTIVRNGQVCRLRGLLNDELDPEARRIRIAAGLPTDWKFLYREETFNSADGGTPMWAGPANEVSTDEYGNKTLVFDSGNTSITLVESNGAIGSSGYDFTVEVPEALRDSIDIARLTALVNYYKLASKRYIIQFYE